MKNKKQNESSTSVADSITTTESGHPVVGGAVQISVSEGTKKKLGRPIDPNSDRAKKIAVRQAKAEANFGYIALGRPAMSDSKRQLALLAKKAAAENGEVRGKGRPKMTEEDKAIAKQKRDADKAAYLERVAVANAGTQMTGAAIVE